MCAERYKEHGSVSHRLGLSRCRQKASLPYRCWLQEAKNVFKGHLVGKWPLKNPRPQPSPSDMLECLRGQSISHCHGHMSWPYLASGRVRFLGAIVPRRLDKRPGGSWAASNSQACEHHIPVLLHGSKALRVTGAGSQPGELLPASKQAQAE